jgi:hypothetical protein
LGRARRAPAGAIRRWKAPRVQRIAFPFAGVRVRRPCPQNRDRKGADRWGGGSSRERARSQARSCQGTPEGDPRDAGNSSLRSPRAATRGVRAEWVGAKLSRERSRREVLSRGKLTSTKPLAHDISTGRAPEREAAAIRSSGPRSKGRGHETGCTGGRPLVRSCGVQSSVVVLAGRIDCRSRQAARGPSRPEAKSLWITMSGSSPTARERRRGERASEAGSSVAKPRDRWRAPSKPVGSRERIDLGAPVEGRRFGSGKSSSLTRGRRKRSWLLESVRVQQARKASGRDRERQRSDVSLARGRKRQRRGGAARTRRCPDLHLAERRTEPCTDRPKLEARRQARAQPGSDCRKTVRRRTGRTRLLRKGERGSILRSTERKLRARKSSGPRVLVSRVGCRSRREASSPRHRGEPRGEPRSHGVARCGGGS